MNCNDCREGCGDSKVSTAEERSADMAMENHLIFEVIHCSIDRCVDSLGMMATFMFPSCMKRSYFWNVVQYVSKHLEPSLSTCVVDSDV